ncbi:MAG: DUF2892 domain-containing protein [Bacteroidota bacterium]|nr:DUF2892 domain-containing protein [Candidatus Kapabacteria bacterium]MDW8219645.1 DUF2892 domain-containing protein [Bacteroidota bacterium]
MLKVNIGQTDRILRIIFGLAIIAVGVYVQSWWGAIGLIPLATAIIRWCPLYAPLGISTCRASSDEKA